MRFAALTAVAAVSVIGAGTYAFVSMSGDSSPAPVPPVGSNGPEETEQPHPEPTASGADNPAYERTCYAYTHEPRWFELPARTTLPYSVLETRLQIIDHATICQYELLEQLALQGDPGFHYSFGVEESPARFWEDREREAHRRNEPSWSYMRGLVAILRMPHCRETNDDGTGTDTQAVYYIWPRVHCADHRTADDWNDLKGLYTDEQIEQMRTGDLYAGFRVGILKNGDWVYFVAGD